MPTTDDQTRSAPRAIPVLARAPRLEIEALKTSARRAGRGWGLRLRLLGPLLLLLMGAAAGWGLVSDLSTRRQIDVLVDQQGTAVLQGIDLRLRELRQAKELNARLL